MSVEILYQAEKLIEDFLRELARLETVAIMSSDVYAYRKCAAIRVLLTKKEDEDGES